MDPDIKRFVDEFRNTQFSHSEHLFSGLDSKLIQLHRVSEKSELTASHYYDVYKLRLNMLNQRFKERHTVHTEQLAVDTSILIEGLSRFGNQICDVWTFFEKPYFVYTVWIGRGSRTIFGCIRSADDRLVTPDTRKELWGDQSFD